MTGALGFSVSVDSANCLFGFSVFALNTAVFRF